MQLLSALSWTRSAGRKEQLHWFRTYVVAVLSSPGQQEAPTTYALQIFDLRNKLIAISIPLTQVSAKRALLLYKLHQ